MKRGINPTMTADKTPPINDSGLAETHHGIHGKWHLAFPLTECQSAEMQREVVIGERILAVFRHQMKWFAIDGMCAHQGGPLADGVVQDGCVTCPWHGWQYDLASGIQTINRQPLQETFPVRLRDEQVEIWLPS